jgi:hypothetical protein
MTIRNKMLLGAAAIAATATAASAQYYPPYGGNYGAPYGNAYGYHNNANANAMAVSRCTAAVQQRLSTRTGVAGILGAVLGARTSGGQVVSVTQVRPRASTVRVRGLATSGANYGPYGYGAYGAAGYGYAPDLSFSCAVDYQGRIRDIDINRRR